MHDEPRVTFLFAQVMVLPYDLDIFCRPAPACASVGEQRVGFHQDILRVLRAAEQALAIAQREALRLVEQFVGCSSARFALLW